MSRERHIRQRELQRALGSGAPHRVLRVTQRLAELRAAERELDRVGGGLAARTPTTDRRGRRLDVVISSFQLLESFAYCTAAREEGMHFFVGFDVGSIAVVSGMRTFAYESRSVVHATGDPQETSRICCDTLEGGHRILVIVHAHPGTGPHANHPSGRDIAGQRNWEPWNRQIGGIWSRDGYLRFWTLDLPFVVRIKGTHFEQIEETLWRIRDAHDFCEAAAPLALPAPEESG